MLAPPPRAALARYRRRVDPQRWYAIGWGVVGIVAVLLIWELYKLLGPRGRRRHRRREGESGSGVMILPRTPDLAMPHMWDMAARLFEPTAAGDTPPLWVSVASAALVDARHRRRRLAHRRRRGHRVRAGHAALAMEGPGARAAHVNFAAALDDDGEVARTESAQTRCKAIRLRGVDADAQESREFARESRHPALFPVAANSEHLIGELLDNPGSVCADDGQDQRCAHGVSSHISKSEVPQSTVLSLRSLSGPGTEDGRLETTGISS